MAATRKSWDQKLQTTDAIIGAFQSRNFNAIHNDMLTIRLKLDDMATESTYNPWHGTGFPAFSRKTSMTPEARVAIVAFLSTVIGEYYLTGGGRGDKDVDRSMVFGSALGAITSAEKAAGATTEDGSRLEYDIMDEAALYILSNSSDIEPFKAMLSAGMFYLMRSRQRVAAKILEIRNYKGYLTAKSYKLPLTQDEKAEIREIRKELGPSRKEMAAVSRKDKERITRARMRIGPDPTEEELVAIRQKMNLVDEAIAEWKAKREANLRRHAKWFYNQTVAGDDGSYSDE